VGFDGSFAVSCGLFWSFVNLLASSLDFRGLFGLLLGLKKRLGERMITYTVSRMLTNSTGVGCECIMPFQCLLIL